MFLLQLNSSSDYLDRDAASLRTLHITNGRLGPAPRVHLVVMNQWNKEVHQRRVNVQRQIRTLLFHQI